MVYEVDNNGMQTGSFTQFTNGRVSFVQSFDDILDQHSFNRIVNHVQGERMESPNLVMSSSKERDTSTL